MSTTCTLHHAVVCWVTADGEVVEHPVRGALGRGAVDVITKDKLAEGGEELVAPKAIVVLLVVEGDEDVIAEAKGLELQGGERLGCNGDAKILDGAIRIRRVIRGRTHDVGGRRRGGWRLGLERGAAEEDWI